MFKVDSKVIVTGDTAGMQHGKDAGTPGTVVTGPFPESVTGGMYLVHFGEGDQWYVGAGDLAAAASEFESLLAALALAEEQRNAAVEKVASLEDSVRSERRKGQATLDAFRGDVLDRMKRAVADEWLTREQANEVLHDLDCEKVPAPFRVKVMDGDSTVILDVTIDADDEDDARDKVIEDLTIKAVVSEVKYVIEWNGGGDITSEESEVVEHPDDENGSYADSYEANLTFDVEEV